jgi:hypothetical protein
VGEVGVEGEVGDVRRRNSRQKRQLGLPAHVPAEVDASQPRALPKRFFAAHETELESFFNMAAGTLRTCNGTGFGGGSGMKRDFVLGAGDRGLGNGVRLQTLLRPTAGTPTASDGPLTPASRVSHVAVTRGRETSPSELFQKGTLVCRSPTFARRHAPPSDRHQFVRF